MSETSGELGVALLGSASTAVYHAQLAAGTDAARGGLAAATETAQRLPAAHGAELLAAAREAFLAGLNSAATISAAVMLVVAIVAVRKLRHIPPRRAEDS